MTEITLTRPVEDEGQTYRTLLLDEPTAGGIDAMERAINAGAGDNGGMQALLAHDLGWPLVVVQKIRARDWTRVMEGIAPLLEAETGGAGEALSPTSPQS